MPDFYCRARDFSLSTSVLWPRPTFRLLHSAAAGTSKSIDSKALEGSHVGQNRNNDQVMHTKGNDRWILYQLDFFYARAHSLLPATNERSRRFFGCEFNHLQYVARFMPYVLLLLERKMVHFSRHIPLLLFGDWISHNTLSS